MPVFADTAALIALGDRGDSFHHQAIFVRDELKKNNRNFVTTDAVILELASYFSQSDRRIIAISLIEALNQSPKWKNIPIERLLIKRGFERYKKAADKGWSMVDCISMIVSEDYGITDIFTSDHHFEQAGFRILLNKS